MLRKHRTCRKDEENQQIINDYMEEFDPCTVDMNKVAEWAITGKRWEPPRYNPQRACAHELSKAAGAEYYTDPQGREVRKKHSYTIIDETGQHRWVWVDILTAKPDQMHKSAAARRRQSLGEVVQLARDLESYNENNPYGAMIQMSFNYDEDLLEMKHPEEYPDDNEHVDDA